MIRIKCPKCAKVIAVADSQAGGVGSCSECGQKFRLPGAAAKRSDRPKSVATQRRDADADEHADADEPADDSANENIPRPKKRKKKKKKKEAAAGPKALHIALVAGGILVVAAITGLFFLLTHGSKKKAVDPSQVLAQLQQVHAVIERDQTKPDKPVIGINLMSCEFKAELLEKLSAFPELRKLDLSATLTSDVQLEWIENLTSLRVLNLSGTKITGGGMQFLTKLVELEELNLANTLVDEFRLNELKGLTKLKKIYLAGTLASGQGLQQSIPNLQVVR